jgi:hypothetical protein
MVAKPKHPPGPPMTLGNMRHLRLTYDIPIQGD